MARNRRNGPRSGRARSNQSNQPPPIPPKTPLSKRLVTLRKLPGYALLVLGLAWRGLDLAGRLDVFRQAAAALGGTSAMLIQIMSSIWFSLGLIVIGVSYVVFIGEPPVGVQRHRWWPVVGWGVFATLLLATLSSAGYGYFEIRVREVAVSREPQDRDFPSIWQLALAQALKPDASMFNHALTVTSADNPEANGYASQIMGGISLAGIPLQSSTPGVLSAFPMRALNKGVRGVFFQVRNPNHIPKEVSVLMAALEKVNIDPTIAQNPTLENDDNYILTIGLK